jgi:deoxyribodipyrimidine photo-lyase
MSTTALVWFRNDLRIHDHEALTKAIAKHNTIIAFYCFDERHFAKDVYGFDKTSSIRAQFLIESVQNLRDNLKKLGGDLVVRFGSPAKEIKKIVQDHDVDSIYAYKEITAEERKVELELAEIFSGPINYFLGSTLYHVNDLSFDYRDTPKVFTAFRKLVEKKSSIRPTFPSPVEIHSVNNVSAGEMPTLSTLGLSAQPIDKRSVIDFKGGENAALERLQHYFFDTESLSNYKVTRNGLIGADYSSKLSAWLWNGCISPRQIYWSVKEYEKKIKKNQSTYWLIFELIWRDFFKYIALKHGNAIFKIGGINGKSEKWKEDEQAFHRWANGMTGIPFIDANMRELNQTGFMSNRGRQNVASFFVTELGLDWRKGAAYFESKLIDYDVASNYGNWMYVAGVGNDPRDRYFNVILQAKRYDPKGEYVRLWFPELAELTNSVHHPWTTDAGLFNESELDLDKFYASPMVTPSYWEKHY